MASENLFDEFSDAGSQRGLDSSASGRDDIVANFADTRDRRMSTMAALSLPEDVAAHLQAAIQLSNKRVHLRLLDEAERLVEYDLPNAAIIIAGVILEAFLEGIPRHRFAEIQEQIAQWRELRNRAVHHISPEPNVNQVTDMIRGVRGLLTRDLLAAQDPRHGQEIVETPGQVRGKYKFVATTSTAFIERKADELRLEH